MSDGIVPPLKRCTKCGEEKPATTEYFYRNKSSLKSKCKTCSRDYENEYRQRPDARHRKNDRDREYYHRPDVHCRILEHNRKPEIRARKLEYNRTLSQREYRATYFRQPEVRARRAEKQRTLSAEYYRRPEVRARVSARNAAPEKRQYMAAYKRQNPALMRVHNANRMARKRGLPNTLSQSDWNFALEYFGHVCAACGQAESEGRKLVGDHWIALSDQRHDNPGTVACNIVPLCHGFNGCNNSKCNKDALTWLIDRFGQTQAELINLRIQEYFASLK